MNLRALRCNPGELDWRPLHSAGSSPWECGDWTVLACDGGLELRHVSALYGPEEDAPDELVRKHGPVVARLERRGWRARLLHVHKERRTKDFGETLEVCVPHAGATPAPESVPATHATR